MDHFEEGAPMRAGARRGVRGRDVRSDVDAIALGLARRASRMDSAGAACASQGWRSE